MNVEQFREMFSPWFDIVTKRFQDSFSEDYDMNILAFLHENIDKEIKLVFSSIEKTSTVTRTQALYNVLTHLYEHILWKLRKEEFPNAALSCVKLLSQLIKTGLLLTQGLTKCEYIDRILTALKLFTGKPALLYDALLLVNGLKRLHHKPYSIILKCILKSDYVEVLDPHIYMGIILLFRRLRALSDSRNKTLFTLATKMKPPSNLISWLVSLNVNDSISFLKLLKHKKIAQQLMKKNIPDSLLKTIRHIILKSYYFEESCNTYSAVTVSENPSDLSATGSSSMLMNCREVQPTETSNKFNLKKVKSKKQNKKITRKEKEDSLLNKKIRLSNEMTKNPSLNTNTHLSYVNNYSNLVIENEHSDSLHESDARDTYTGVNLLAGTSKTVSPNVKEYRKSAKRRKTKRAQSTRAQDKELSKKFGVEIVHVSESESLVDVTDVPAKKLKKDCLYENISSPISPKRSYSENEGFENSNETDIANVKRKKIKYSLESEILKAYKHGHENIDLSPKISSENMCIAAESKLEKICNQNLDKSVEDYKVSFVPESVRNKIEIKRLDMLKNKKQTSIKDSRPTSKNTLASKKVGNSMQYNDNPPSVTDQNKSHDLQPSSLENRKHLVQIPLPLNTSNDTENSKLPLNQSSSKIPKVIKKKKASRRICNEGIPENPSEHSRSMHISSVNEKYTNMTANNKQDCSNPSNEIAELACDSSTLFIDDYNLRAHITIEKRADDNSELSTENVSKITSKPFIETASVRNSEEYSKEINEIDILNSKTGTVQKDFSADDLLHSENDNQTAGSSEIYLECNKPKNSCQEEISVENVSVTEEYSKETNEKDISNSKPEIDQKDFSKDDLLHSENDNLIAGSSEIHLECNKPKNNSYQEEISVEKVSVSEEYSKETNEKDISNSKPEIDQKDFPKDTLLYSENDNQTAGSSEIYLECNKPKNNSFQEEISVENVSVTEEYSKETNEKDISNSKPEIDQKDFPKDDLLYSENDNQTAGSSEIYLECNKPKNSCQEEISVENVSVTEEYSKETNEKDILNSKPGTVQKDFSKDDLLHSENDNQIAGSSEIYLECNKPKNNSYQEEISVENVSVTEEYSKETNEKDFSKDDLLHSKNDNQTAGSSEIYLECNKPKNNSYQEEISVENSSYTENLEAESKFIQISNKESEISHECSNTDSTCEEISFSSQNHTLHKSISVSDASQKRENEPSINSNMCSAQQLNDSNKKDTFQSDVLQYKSNCDDSASGVKSNIEQKKYPKDETEIDGVPCVISSNVNSRINEVIPHMEVDEKHLDLTKDNNEPSIMSKPPVKSNLEYENVNEVAIVASQKCNYADSGSAYLDASNSNDIQNSFTLSSDSNKLSVKSIEQETTDAKYKGIENETGVKDSVNDFPSGNFESEPKHFPISNVEASSFVHSSTHTANSTEEIGFTATNTYQSSDVLLNNKEISQEKAISSPSNILSTHSEFSEDLDLKCDNTKNTIFDGELKNCPTKGLESDCSSTNKTYVSICAGNVSTCQNILQEKGDTVLENCNTPSPEKNILPLTAIHKESSKLSDSDLSQLSFKNTNEETVQIDMNCKVSKMGVEESVENSSTKNIEFETKCTQKSNLESRLDAQCSVVDKTAKENNILIESNNGCMYNLVPNISLEKDKETSDKIDYNSETSLQEGKDCVEKNIKQSMFVESQSNIKRECIPQNDIKTGDTSVGVIVGSVSQTDVLTDVVSQDDEKIANIINEVKIDLTDNENKFPSSVPIDAISISSVSEKEVDYSIELNENESTVRKLSCHKSNSEIEESSIDDSKDDAKFVSEETDISQKETLSKECISKNKSSDFNLSNKSVTEANLDKNLCSVLTTGCSCDTNISCSDSRDIQCPSCTEGRISKFTSEADSEEIDVVNISNDNNESLSNNVVSVIKEDPPFVAKNENTFKTLKEANLKDNKISEQNTEKGPLESMSKVVSSEYIPYFCKNKDYVSFSDISLRNKNRNLVIDSGLKNPNPITNFSSAATAEIFCEYRNGILHGDKTDTLSRDDVASNMQELSDATKSPSVSSDEEFDSQPCSSADEDLLLDVTEKVSEEYPNKIAAETSDSSVSFKSKDVDMTIKETDMKDNSCSPNKNIDDNSDPFAKKNECTEESILDKKESSEKLFTRQSLRIRNKIEINNKVSSEENSEAGMSSEKESESATEITDNTTCKKSSPRSDNSTCNDFTDPTIISAKDIPDVPHSPEKTLSSQKSMSRKNVLMSKSKSKIKPKDFISPPKCYSLRRRKSRQLTDDSSNLGIDLTKLQLDSPSCSKNTSCKSTKDVKFAKLLSLEIDSQKNADFSDITLNVKRETRSSTAKIEQETAQNTPGYNLRARKSIIAPGKLKI